MHHERGTVAPSRRSSCTTDAVWMHHPARRIHVRKFYVSFVLLGLGKALPNKFLTETEEANAEIRATGRYLL